MIKLALNIPIKAKVPVAEFTAVPRSGNQPTIVQFINLSENAKDYLWDFGDGETSTLKNPVHEYTETGSYTIKLIASNRGGFSIEIKEDYIIFALDSIQFNGIDQQYWYTAILNSLEFNGIDQDFWYTPLFDSIQFDGTETQYTILTTELSSLLFNGTNTGFLTMSNADLCLTSEWTMTGWSLFTDFDTKRGLVSKGNPTIAGGEYALFAEQTTGELKFQVRLADNSDYEEIVGPIIFTNEFIFWHIWVDATNNKMCMRVNLSPVIENTNLTGGGYVGTSDFRIGSINGNSLHKGRGALFALWNRHLNADSEPDFLAVPKDFDEWGQVGTDGADLLTDLVEAWRLNETGNAVGWHSANELTVEGTPIVASGPMAPNISYNTLVDAVGGENVSLINFANSKFSRDIEYPSALGAGVSLRTDGLEEYGELDEEILSETNETICGWINRLTNNSCPFFSNLTGGYILRPFQDGRLYFANSDGSDGFSANISGFNNVGTWYHYGITKDNDTYKVYINGLNNPNGGGASFTKSFTFSGIKRFFRYGNEYSWAYHADFRKYNITLSDAQMAELAAGGEATGATPIHKWISSEVR